MYNVVVCKNPMFGKLSYIINVNIFSFASYVYLFCPSLVHGWVVTIFLQEGLYLRGCGCCLPFN